MMKHLLLLTFKGIRHRPTRSWLTVLGIVIGIMLVVIILALSTGIQNVVKKTLQMFGSDLVIIFPGKETNPLAGLVGGVKFREADLLALERIPGVRFVVPMNISVQNTEFKGEKKSTLIHAASWKNMRIIFESSQGIQLSAGAWPVRDDTNEVVLGYLVANEMFKSPLRVGEEMTIKSKRFKIVGVMSKIGIQEDDNSVFVSMEQFRELTGAGLIAGSAIVKMQPEADVNVVARQIRSRLEEQEVVRDFSVLTPQKADRLVGSVLSVIELVLIIIAFVSLLVGGIGIMNTMYTSVLERTKQIGIIKAVGASDEAIMTLFLMESGIIGFVGGALGLILGLSVSFAIGILAGRFGIHGLFSILSLDWVGLCVVLLLTFVIGVVSGVLPARQAARMEPAEALRYE